MDLTTNEADLLRNADLVQGKILELTGNFSLKILDYSFYQFQPEGVTGILLLQESHFAFHTWPEKNLITFDIFCCRESFEFEIFLEQLKIFFKVKDCKVLFFERGNFGGK